jgi:ABC-type Fe3+ transport system permease subunit
METRDDVKIKAAELIQAAWRAYALHVKEGVKSRPRAGRKLLDNDNFQERVWEFAHVCVCVCVCVCQIFCEACVRAWQRVPGRLLELKVSGCSKFMGADARAWVSLCVSGFCSFFFVSCIFPVQASRSFYNDRCSVAADDVSMVGMSLSTAARVGEKLEEVETSLASTLKSLETLRA